MSKTAIVGSGIAGLAVAARLAAEGHEVTVFEKNEFPGGKLSEIRSGDFRFDAGPSLFTMPKWLDEVFESAGKNPRDYFDFERLNVLCNYYWQNGKSLRFYADWDLTSKAMVSRFGERESALSDYLLRSEKKYQSVGEIFLKKPMNALSTWWNMQVVKALFKLPRYDMFKTLHQVNQKHFKSPEMVQLFNRYATYNGSDPFRTSGMFSMIPHIELNLGAYAPKGGMIEITHSLVRLGKDLGIQYRFSSEVTKITTRSGSCTGIELSNGEKISFDRVVSNMDVNLTYSRLLPEISPPKKLNFEERSSSGFIFYWGMNKVFPELDVHNIFFSSDYREEFKAIQSGRIADDLTVYINISSKYHSADAPEGMENWFVMVNVPVDTGQDWTEYRKLLKTKILKRLESDLGTSVGGHIITEEVLDPRMLSKRTMSADGALYGSSSNNKWAAFLRQSNRHSKVRNLYFCGGSVHPGGGIPLCLSSAEIVADIIRGEKK